MWLIIGILLVVLIIFLIWFFYTPSIKKQKPKRVSVKCDHCERVAAVWGSSPDCSNCPYKRGSSIVGDDLNRVK